MGWMASSSTTTSDDQLGAQLRALVREVVREELRATQPTNAEVYGSRAPHAPCPGHSHRWSRDTIPTMPGAVRTGGKRGPGVLWTIARADYEVWLVSRTTTTANVTPAATATADVVCVDNWIAQSGHRRTRMPSR